MVTVPAPTHAVTREEWPDADFDLPDGDLIPTTHGQDSDKDEEDWDVEMELGKTGGAKVTLASVDHRRSSPVTRRMITIRPPLAKLEESPSFDMDEDEEEGVSTIKVSTITAIVPKLHTSRPVEEDMESDFALPSDMTQLSLRPLSLHHRGSKSSLEWGERDHTSSSASSSDAYSSLGFGMATSPSSNSTSASLPGTDDDVDDEDDGDLDGIVIPAGIFDSEQGRKHLTMMLDMKRRMPTVEEHVKVSTPDPEDDFEIGLIINGDDDLKASKLSNARNQPRRLGTLSSRSRSMPSQPAIVARPPSRIKSERPKMPGSQGVVFGQGSSRNIPSPPHRRLQPKRSQTYQPFPPQAPSTSALILPKPSVLRGQKSHSVLKSPSPPSTSRRLSRKASLSSLLETSSAQDSSPSVAGPSLSHRYNAPTASSRARAHTNSTSRLHSADLVVPPTRPSTPSSKSAAIRLTLPTNMSRIKSRPSISSIFPSATAAAQQAARTSPPRPSTLFRRTPTPTSAVPGPAKVLRRTKRQVFGDGTELDGIDDLPTDRDKEARYRVQPKGSQNRIPGGSYARSEKDTGKGTIRRKLDQTTGSSQTNVGQPASAFNSLGRRQQRVDASSRSERKRSQNASASTQTKRKPTLIRNLGGPGVPKVVGEMRWNPHTLRWEGNDQVLREFDAAVGTSIRPALITHLTGSSICSPIGNFGPTARIVGNMVFDPVQMCWKSTLPPEEDEPDIFADMADDEEEGEGWEGKAGTIRASQQALHSVSDVSANTDSSRMQSPSPVQHTHSRTHSESGSERGSRASLVFDVQDEFLDTCRAAENRHRLEMKGWAAGLASSCSSPDRSHLHDIRTLATRQY